MLQTIAIEIDAQGQIRPVEPFVSLPVGRGFLTMLEETTSRLAPRPMQITNKAPTTTAFQELFGMLTASQGASLEEMERAILQRVRERFDDRS